MGMHAPISICIEIDPAGFTCPPAPPEGPCVLDPCEMVPPMPEEMPCIPGMRKPGSTIMRRPGKPAAMPECMELPPEVMGMLKRMTMREDGENEEKGPRPAEKVERPPAKAGHKDSPFPRKGDDEEEDADDEE